VNKALNDHYANGGLGGADMVMLEGSDCFAFVSGLVGHKLISY
jgi:hypothetical protein